MRKILKGKQKQITSVKIVISTNHFMYRTYFGCITSLRNFMIRNPGDRDIFVLSFLSVFGPLQL